MDKLKLTTYKLVKLYRDNINWHGMGSWSIESREIEKYDFVPYFLDGENEEQEITLEVLEILKETKDYYIVMIEDKD